VDLVVGDPSIALHQYFVGAQTLGIQVEGALQIILIQKFNEPDILCYAVIIAEGNGFFLVLIFELHGDRSYVVFLYYTKRLRKCKA
jgi:hypothetical protein